MLHASPPAAHRQGHALHRAVQRRAVILTRSRRPAARDAADATNGAPQPSPESSSRSTPDAKVTKAPAPDTLDLAYESDAAAKKAHGVTKTTGLRRAPLSGGVKTATNKYDLPSPAVAVRNLVEQAQFAHLCTVMSTMHHRRGGYPFGTLVDFASDGAGYPIFCLSPLAIHARNLIEDPRCSMVVQMPGWTGLANARVTIFGDVYQLPADMQEAAREIFIAKHASSDRQEKWVFGNFLFFRMHRIVDIYFVGGFGTVQWIAPDDFLACKPDNIVLDNPSRTLQALNDLYADEMRTLLAVRGAPADDAMFISIDSNGADVRVRHGSEFTVERIGFDVKVNDLEDAKACIEKTIAVGRL